MEDKFAIQLFEDNKVRVVWNEEQEKYFFSVVDIIQVLTDSVNPTDYIKKMKSRDKELAEGWGQFVTPPLHIEQQEASKKLISPICKASFVSFSPFLPRKPSLSNNGWHN